MSKRYDEDKAEAIGAFIRAIESDTDWETKAFFDVVPSELDSNELIIRANRRGVERFAAELMTSSEEMFRTNWVDDEVGERYALNLWSRPRPSYRFEWIEFVDVQSSSHEMNSNDRRETLEAIRNSAVVFGGLAVYFLALIGLLAVITQFR